MMSSLETCDLGAVSREPSKVSTTVRLWTSVLTVMQFLPALSFVARHFLGKSKSHFQTAIRCGYRVRTLSLIGTHMQPHCLLACRQESDPHTKTLSDGGDDLFPLFDEAVLEGCVVAI